MARLSVPALGIDLFVLDAATPRALAFVVPELDAALRDPFKLNQAIRDKLFPGSALKALCT